MLVGYMRVSSDSDRQTTDLQRDALLNAGVDERHLFEDKASGARSDRSGLAKALDFVRAGDCLVVWKLDRLGSSLTEHMDTTTPQRTFPFIVFGALPQYERALARGRIMAGLEAIRKRRRRMPQLRSATDDAVSCPHTKCEMAVVRTRNTSPVALALTPQHEYNRVMS